MCIIKHRGMVRLAANLNMCIEEWMILWWQQHATLCLHWDLLHAHCLSLLLKLSLTLLLRIVQNTWTPLTVAGTILNLLSMLQSHKLATAFTQLHSLARILLGSHSIRFRAFLDMCFALIISSVWSCSSSASVARNKNQSEELFTFPEPEPKFPSETRS